MAAKLGRETRHRLFSDPVVKQKKSVPITGVLGTALRAAIIVLAYQHIIMPKQATLPRGTERTLWWSVKNAYKMGRWWLRFGYRHARHSARSDADSPIE